MSKTVKGAKTAKAVKTAKKGGMKLVKITPVADRDILERGAEFDKLRKQGFSQTDVIAMYKNAGIEVSAPAYYNALKIYRAPKEVRQAIREGKVVPTLVLPFLKKKFSKEEIIASLNELIAQREQHSQFLQKSGFEGGSKLTLKRAVSLVRKRLERLQKTKTLDDVRGQAALALTRALDSIHSAEDIESVVAEFAKKA